MTDKAYTWAVLKGIENEYSDLYNRCIAQIDTLTWNNLMEELQKQAVAEDQGLALVQIKKPVSNKTLITCKTCSRLIFPEQRHCDDCGWHPSGSDCWSCCPEKAPDTWHRKEEFLQKKTKKTKKTAQISTTPTITSSTTGPLLQQSGVANPTTKSVLFTTNLASLPGDPENQWGVVKLEEPQKLDNAMACI